jgi:hypothetical protein
VIAAGILAGTALTVMASQSSQRWPLPLGPLLLAMSILLARFLDLRWTSSEVVALFGASSFTVLSEPLDASAARSLAPVLFNHDNDVPHPDQSSGRSRVVIQDCRRTSRAIAIAALVIVTPGVSPGDTFRCGNRLVSEQSSISEIISRCGAPTSKEASEVHPTIRNKNGSVVRLPPVRTEVWTYRRESGALPMRVTIVDGKVKAVEIAK